MPRDLDFKIFRKSASVGRYSVNFKKDGDLIEVSGRIEIAIKVAFVTAYSYEQRTRDTWRNGVLISAEINTDDNGTRSRVLIREHQDRLVIEGPQGLVEAPLGTMTDGSLWNMEITAATQVIDGQRGDLMAVQGHGPFYERLTIHGKSLPTKRFTFQSDAEHDLAGTFWYDNAQTLARIVLETRGEKFTYEPVAGGLWPSTN